MDLVHAYMVIYKPVMTLGCRYRITHFGGVAIGYYNRKTVVVPFVWLAIGNKKKVNSPSYLEELIDRDDIVHIEKL